MKNWWNFLRVPLFIWLHMDWAQDTQPPSGPNILGTKVFIIHSCFESNFWPCIYLFSVRLLLQWRCVWRGALFDPEVCCHIRQQNQLHGHSWIQLNSRGWWAQHLCTRGRDPEWQRACPLPSSCQWHGGHILQLPNPPLPPLVLLVCDLHLHLLCTLPLQKPGQQHWCKWRWGASQSGIYQFFVCYILNEY